MKWTPNTATNRSKNGSRIRDLGIERWVRCRHRRISKTVQRLSVTTAPPPSPPVETYEWNTIEYRAFAYDDWNLIHETVATIEGGTTNTTEIQYFWGLDLSDSLQDAGGVGGLLAVSYNGQFYFPTYDNNGNITKYIDESGNVVEEIGPHRTFYDDAVFEQLKVLHEKALQRAREICETSCYKDGVWVRYQFSPSNNLGARVLDWLKGNSSRNKPSQLIGGGVWEGDTHVKCH